MILLEGGRTLAATFDRDLLPRGARALERQEHLEDVVGELAARPMRPLVADRPRKLGDPDSAPDIAGLHKRDRRPPNASGRWRRLLELQTSQLNSTVTSAPHSNSTAPVTWVGTSTPMRSPRLGPTRIVRSRKAMLLRAVTRTTGPRSATRAAR